MDPRIKKIGKVLHVGSKGYLVSESSKNNIVSPWDAPVQDLIDEYTKRLGDNLHSLYIRGSVARGTAVENMSDIDGLLLLKAPCGQLEVSWYKDFEEQFLARHSFVKGLDIPVKNVEEMVPEQNPVGCFTLKVMAVCVAGEDILPQLPRVKPGPGAFVVRWGLKKMLESRAVEDVSRRQIHLAKHILRTGMELVMEREQAFTRDLYPCYELFSKYYPQYSEKMYRVLKLALFPTNKKTDLKFLEQEIGIIVAQLFDELYPLKN